MSFIRDVLARARGGALRIRPRRDFAGVDDEDGAGIVDDEVPRVQRDAYSREEAAPAMPHRPRAVQAHLGTGDNGGEHLSPRRAAEKSAAPPTTNQRDAKGDASPNAASPSEIAEHRAAVGPATLEQSIARLFATESREPVQARAHDQRVTPRHTEDKHASTQHETPLQIDIHIGRVEVVPPPATRAPNPAARNVAQPPRLTLADYLAQRSAKR